MKPNQLRTTEKPKVVWSTPLPKSLSGLPLDERRYIVMVERFWAKLIRNNQSGCFEWMGIVDDCGYGLYYQREGNQRGYEVLAHRFAWASVWGPIPEGLCICHDCDHPRCCNPNHLFLGTDKDNAKDAWQKRRKGHSLSKPEVRWIRKKVADGWHDFDIAKAMNLPVSIVTNARMGNWKPGQALAYRRPAL